ncbi:TetR/AcrR family transcriptional regulator [Cellulomonas pakistanensis]|uniref:TetR family transcriptional regulator n=1 Tax=Cellulomonas pakistanensis TaxID=992287 RepID=A0A919U2W4_9CELL|nr:TetR/AcrR family transcriptional regulator [Cellulomonas pakistanensis]GIG36518.1 TetR family transcriptional regulator [Cellulomonas pakistanensis]
MTTPSTPSTPLTRPLRADAARNRARLLQCAVSALAEDGDAPLESIAQQAGVGIGTLYRHFPERSALVEAAYRQEVAELCDAAPALLGQDRPAVEALREWMGRFVRYAAAKRGMGAALRTAVGSDSSLFADTKARIVAAIDVLLAAGREDGSVRPDVDGEQVMLAMGGVWNVPDSDRWAERVRGLLDLVVDGLRYGAGAAPR